jgi:hypothetical protein
MFRMLEEVSSRKTISWFFSDRLAAFAGVPLNSSNARKDRIAGMKRMI